MKAKVIVAVLAVPGAVRKRELAGEYSALEERLDVDRIGETMEPLMEIHDDLDQRISLLVGSEGSFSTDYGMVDMPSIFGAFRERQEPLSTMADQGRAYFAHLLERIDPRPKTESGDSDAWAVSLLVAGARIASLDSPLAGHRVASAMFLAIEKAIRVDAETTSALLQDFLDKGEVLFEGSLNSEDALKGLFKAEADGDAEDRTYLRVILGNYQQIVETAYRECGWLTYRLMQVHDGEQPQVNSDSPTTGSLVSHLKGKSGHELARNFLSAIDVDLRNAVGHSRYSWDNRHEIVKDTRTGRTWTLDDVSSRVQSVADLVAGGLAGIDCAYAVGLLEDPEPNWPLPGESPDLTKMLARMLFRAAGATVLAVHRDGTIEISEKEAKVEAARLVGPTLSVFGLMDSASTMKVVSSGETPVLEISADSLRAATDLDGLVGPLGVPIPFLDHIERSGGKAEAALRETLAIQIRLLVTMMVEDLLNRNLDDPEYWSLVAAQAKRIEYVVNQAKQRNGASSKRNLQVISKLERLLNSVRRASATHDPEALRRIGNQSAGLLRWATDQDVRWPPI